MGLSGRIDSFPFGLKFSNWARAEHKSKSQVTSCNEFGAGLLMASSTGTIAACGSGAPSIGKEASRLPFTVRKLSWGICICTVRHQYLLAFLTSVCACSLTRVHGMLERLLGRPWLQDWLKGKAKYSILKKKSPLEMWNTMQNNIWEEVPTAHSFHSVI